MILSQSKYCKRLQRDALIKNINKLRPKTCKRDGIINPENYNFIQIQTRKFYALKINNIIFKMCTEMVFIKQKVTGLLSSNVLLDKGRRQKIYIKSVFLILFPFNFPMGETFCLCLNVQFHENVYWKFIKIL